MAIQMKPETTEYGAYFPPGFEQLYLDMGFGTRWPHFSFHELACRGSGSLRVHYAPMDALEYLRRLYGGPIPITSYYRSPSYNREIGGAQGSMHLLGRAIDTPNISILRPAQNRARPVSMWLNVW